MSWPTDGEPRYTIGGVTGYSISPGEQRSEHTIWHVSDRAYCCQTVWEFHDVADEAGRKKAQALADALNSGEEVQIRDARRWMKRTLAQRLKVRRQRERERAA